MTHNRSLLEATLTALENLASAIEIRLDTTNVAAKELTTPLIRELCAEAGDLVGIVQEEMTDG